jgi:hypothetical protein
VLASNLAVKAGKRMFDCMGGLFKVALVAFIVIAIVNRVPQLKTLAGA